MDGFLTTNDIANRLDVKIETVRRWVRLGKLPGLHLGRAGYRIRQEDFERFLQGQSPQRNLHKISSSSTHPDNSGEAPIEHNHLEERLYERERQLASLIEHLPDVVFRLDQQLRHLYISPVIEKVTGIPPEAWLGKTGREMGLPQAACDQFEAACQRAMVTGQEQQMEFVHYGRWKRSRIIPEYNADGSLRSFMGITQDITEQKQAEEERKRQDLNATFLSDLEKVFAHLSTPDEIIQMAGEQIARYFSLSHLFFVEVNERANEFICIYAYHKQTLNTTRPYRLSDYLNKKDLSELKARQAIVMNDTQTDPRAAPYAAIYKACQIRAQLLVPRLSDGRLDFVMVAQYSTPYSWQHNESELLQELATRIYLRVERARIEATLSKTAEQFRTLAENIPNLAWMARPDGWIYWYNSRWYEYTGTTPQQMEGWGWQSVHDPQVLPTVMEQWISSIRKEEPFEMVFPLKGADGVFRPFLTRILPIYNAEGQLVHWFGTNTDITEQKRLEKQKDEFIGIASHELKTPVTSLKGYAQILEQRFRKTGDSRSAELMQKMEIQINRLTGLVEDLLDVTKIENGQLIFHFSSFNYNTLIKEMIEEIQRTTGRHTIIQALDTSVTLLADRDRVGQVLTNLLTNAIKYSPRADTIIVKSTCTDETIITSVQDFGIGIPKEKQSQLFKRFYRVEGESQVTYPGLGLGLYISAAFIKRHHGSIWVESEEGRGTTFSFSLPLHLSPEEEES